MMMAALNDDWPYPDEKGLGGVFEISTTNRRYCSLVTGVGAMRCDVCSTA